MDFPRPTLCFAPFSGSDTKPRAPAGTWYNRQGQESSPLRVYGAETMSRLYRESRIICKGLFGEYRQRNELMTGRFHGSSKLPTQSPIAVQMPRTLRPRTPNSRKDNPFSGNIQRPQSVHRRLRPSPVFGGPGTTAKANRSPPGSRRRVYGYVSLRIPLTPRSTAVPLSIHGRSRDRDHGRALARQADRPAVLRLSPRATRRTLTGVPGSSPFSKNA